MDFGIELLNRMFLYVYVVKIEDIKLIRVKVVKVMNKFIIKLNFFCVIVWEEFI